MKFLIYIALLVLSVSAEKARFDNYRVYTVYIENQEQYEAMKHFEEFSDSYDVFDSPAIHAETELLVPPHKFAEFEEIGERLNWKAEVVINNYQELLDHELSTRRKLPKAQISWTQYNTLAEINEWLAALPSQHSGVTVEDVQGIRTHENRTIKMVTISKRAGNRAIIIESNIHAREWISSASTLWFINELLTSTDPAVVNARETIDWYILPMMNPDGFQFTWDSNRNWRKTRSIASSLCFGVDANRNCGFNWLTPDETGNLGASTTPCSDTFAGPAPGSEPEIQALDRVLTAKAAQTDIFFSFHSYGHWLLYPFGHRRNTPIPNQRLHEDIGAAFRNTILAIDNINYRVGNSNLLLYATSGTTPDHAYGQYNIPVAYTVEMRGNGAYGNYGFVLPPQFIIINSQEIFQGLMAMIPVARQNGLL